MILGLTSISTTPWFFQTPLPEFAGLILLLFLWIGYQRIKRLRQNELFRIVSENAADMIALVEVTGKRLYNSPAYEKVLGYSPQELAATGSLDSKLTVPSAARLSLISTVPFSLNSAFM